MGLKQSDLAESAPDASPLGSWHTNLLYIDYKKCILFVNDKTLFNFIAIGHSRAEIRELSVIFVSNLAYILTLEGFSEKKIKEIMREYEPLQYAKTNSKSILGSMNDLAFHYKYHIQNEGRDAVPSIIRKVNRMPMGVLDYAFPIEELKRVCRC